ncbi:MAG TPA: sensor histidine kinase [Bacillota bacterium]|nr:sensor histidine kinase [Bacillota bacterium]
MKPKVIFSLRAKIGILVFFLVLLSTGISGAMLIEKVFEAIEKELGQRALSIARSVAQVDEVIQSVGHPEGFKVIQPTAEKIRLATDVEYVVVFDMNRIRYSSPLSSKIGTVFDSGDEGASLAELAYISRAYGVLGPSIRAFVPIMNGSKQVGVVVVGMITPTYFQLLTQYHSDLNLILIIGLGIGLFGAFLLAYDIKKQMFNMEPGEIARLLEERIAVFKFIGEGIVATDKDSQITIINSEASRILGIDESAIGKKVDEIIPNTQLVTVMQTGIPQYNEDRMLGNIRILATVLPIRIKGEIVGAVATFRDKTTVLNLSEELTGVKQFIEALRVQNHEYMNKLHTIAGLLQLNKTDQALNYIFDITEKQEELASFLTNQICDYSIAGLLLGKVSRAKELGIDLHIDRRSRLNSIPDQWDTGVFIAVLGNLLENAMEALQGQPLEKRRIICLLKDSEDSLFIQVEDNGPGIPNEIRDQIYIQGFSTKENKLKNRGIGLALVYRYVEGAGGTIELESKVGVGTCFAITIPRYEGEEKPL